jgi:CheY-like chemotaxis protein
VRGDPARLEQVVTNLLANAAKYTPKRGHVWLRLSRRGDRAEISVGDDGVGISPDVLPQVFELFRQGPESLARSQGGLGIGLTVAKHIVELHGGTIVATSGGPGQGAEFTLRLSLDATGSRSVEAPSPAAGLADDDGHRRVLVVEDADDMREALRMILESLGHAVDDAPDGLTGLDRALASKPEVMIIDIGLPGIDGYELARRVRAVLGDRVKLVALTGYGQPEDRSRALASGFDEHLTKPGAIDELAAIVGSAATARGRPTAGTAAGMPGEPGSP